MAANVGLNKPTSKQFWVTNNNNNRVIYLSRFLSTVCENKMYRGSNFKLAQISKTGVKFPYLSFCFERGFVCTVLQAATVTATLEKSNRVKAVVVEISADQALLATGCYPTLKVYTFITML